MENRRANIKGGTVAFHGKPGGLGCVRPEIGNFIPGTGRAATPCINGDAMSRPEHDASTEAR
jgi:hypothetical protein